MKKIVVFLVILYSISCSIMNATEAAELAEIQLKQQEQEDKIIALEKCKINIIPLIKLNIKKRNLIIERIDIHDSNFMYYILNSIFNSYPDRENNVFSVTDNVFKHIREHLQSMGYKVSYIELRGVFRFYDVGTCPPPGSVLDPVVDQNKLKIEW